MAFKIGLTRASHDWNSTHAKSSARKHLHGWDMVKREPVGSLLLEMMWYVVSCGHALMTGWWVKLSVTCLVKVAQQQ